MDIIFKNNKQKKSIFLLNNNKLFNLFYFLILLSILQNNLINSFSFPKSITLENGNIFIIHKDGISIFDSSLNREKQIIKTFGDGEKIDDTNKLSKVTISRFSNGYIFCIIIKKIYVFNVKGQLLFEETSNDIINLLTGTNFALLPLKIENNEYTYMIGFSDGNKVNLFFFKYTDDEDQKKNELLKKRDPFAHDCLINGETLQYCGINNNGLTCELMPHHEVDKIYCFFNINHNPQFVTLAIIDPDNYDIIEKGNPTFNQFDVKGFYSVVSPDKKKCLICMHFSKTSSNCTIFSVENNTFSQCIDYGVECRDAAFSSNLEYMRETNQFVFSCSNYNGKLTTTLFDENFNNLGTYTLAEKGSVNGFSIVYSYSKGNYYAVSDIDNSQGNLKFIEISNTTKIDPVVPPEDPDTDDPIIPTTIITTIPTTIITAIPTTIITTIPTTIITTIPTTIPTSILTTTFTTIPTSITIQETIPYICNLEKCEICNKESSSKNLCIKCNKEKNYFQISPLINYNPLIYNYKYIECYNNSTKPTNFYFNKNTNYYEPCYKTCATCDYGGDGNENNCTTCDVDHMKDPEKPNSKNCIAICSYYYYVYFGQYKCTILPQCPDESNLLIREKRQCVDNCSKDSKYKYQYNGECIEKCPDDTFQDEKEHLCKVIESCSESSTKFELYDFLKEGGVEKIAKTYASEFNYTDKHISLFKNEVYSIMLYKETSCISELNLPMPEIDFGACYEKVQIESKLQNKNLIIGIIEKKNNKKNNPITSYAFYNPENGDKLNFEEICKEEVIIVKENIKSLLNDSVSDIDSILFLAGQNIDVFNKSSEFYTSLCYHYESPCDKDVALRDRLLIYYPNITLCDSGCKNTGVNLTAMTAICECKFKNLTELDSEIEDNIYKDVVEEVNKILSQVNLDVMECYKDLFKYEFFISNTGGIIFLILIFTQIVTLIFYYISSLFIVNKYIYNVTENYLLYLNKSPMVNMKVINFKNNDKNKENEENSEQNLKCPPKKIYSSKIDSVELFDLNKSNKKSSTNIKKKKIKSVKTNEENRNNNLLNSEQKKFSHKQKSYSFNKLEKSESSIKSNKASLIDKSKDNKNITFESYLSIDLEDMHFHEVAIIDKRLFFDYFCDKLKKKQLILQLFFINSPLKPLTIKILLLILDIELCFVVNAMFINEDYVSDLFHSKKKETFISFIPRSINRFIYTIFASVVTNYFIRCLFVEENKIKGVLKREKRNINNLKYQINILMKEIKIRYNIFNIIVIVFSAFSWFYISCFNNIYPHMKGEWIKSSFFIIIVIHILSIIVIVIETLLRFISFEIKSERMYRASLWLG